MTGCIAELRDASDPAATGQWLYGLVRDLYPICRSITGNGVRDTLRRIQEIAPIEIHEVRSGTQVFDWEVPREWNIREAWVRNRQGERVIDFARHNLHVVGYSLPVRRRIGRGELLEHLHTLPNQPDLIPYRTAYYSSQWGFCVQHRQLAELTDDEYEVCIDATLDEGSLTYGECRIDGATDAQILVSCHICHPSLCNDNLSAVAIATRLARDLTTRQTRYSYRLLFIPGTIGAITWLAKSQSTVGRIEHGLVLTRLGDRGGFTYKRSRQGGAPVDVAVEVVLKHSGHAWQVRDFSPYGYDERQFCSPGFNLPVGRLSRSSHGEFPEYHTSADDLDFVAPDALAESYDVMLQVVDALESNRQYMNLNPMCEPQLGRRGLYATVGGVDRASREMALLWVLNLSDGDHSLLEIAARAGLSFDAVRDAALSLERHHLLALCDAG